MTWMMQVVDGIFFDEESRWKLVFRNLLFGMKMAFITMMPKNTITFLSDMKYRRRKYGKG